MSCRVNLVGVLANVGGMEGGTENNHVTTTTTTTNVGGTHIGSRRRSQNKSQYSVEEQALDQIAKEVKIIKFSLFFT